MKEGNQRVQRSEIRDQVDERHRPETLRKLAHPDSVLGLALPMAYLPRLDLVVGRSCRTRRDRSDRASHRLRLASRSLRWI